MATSWSVVKAAIWVAVKPVICALVMLARSAVSTATSCAVVSAASSVVLSLANCAVVKATTWLVVRAANCALVKAEICDVVIFTR